MIKKPNDIVEKLVAEFTGIYGDKLLSVIMYGSAVTHEFHSGKSDVNIAFIMTDTSIPVLQEGMQVLSRWLRRGIAAPLFMTPEYISSSLDSYPIEFLDMKHSYRVLSGEDYLLKITIRKQDLRLQCERELRGMAIHLKKGFVINASRVQRLERVLTLAIRTLLPLFKAVLVLFDRKIPNSKAEIIAAVEDLFGLGASVLSDIYNRSNSSKTAVIDRYHKVTAIVESMIDNIDRLHNEQNGRKEHASIQDD